MVAANNTNLKVGDEIELLEDVEAYLIPSGTPVLLSKGDKVTINQALGGSYTVYMYGNLLRIHARYAKALGIESSELESKEKLPGFKVEEDLVWEKLRTCFDPEIPVNIADLGLIYLVEIKEIAADSYHVDIKMTLTAPGCGMGPVLVEDVHEAVFKITNVDSVEVDLVFDPPWDQSMMTEGARLQLGLL